MPTQRTFIIVTRRAILQNHLVKRSSTFLKRPLSNSRISHSTKVLVDELCIPIRPTQSSSLSSLTKPSLSDEELIHLHRLSALKPPPTASPEFINLKADLLAMLEVVDSVKAFVSSDLGIESAQDIVFREGESQNVPWDAMIQAQESFIKAKAETIPGTLIRARCSPRRAQVDGPESNDASLVTSMARLGYHLIKRKGIGQSPQKESLYYAVRRIRETKV